ncbi:MAG TPA: protein phosphatase 2C domain-containing protein [Pyrinomonadaceae bacterium]|nr:protein phosphatase 2C domain-containing protein [Pyrinomonadaceae bacterium]
MTKETDTKELYRITPLMAGKEFEFLSATVKAEFGGLSHKGKVRPINEDHYLITRLGRDQETLLTNLAAGDLPQHFQEWGYAMVVADGMGGAARGEEASRLAISTLAHLGLQFGRWNLRINKQIAREVTERAERFYQRVGEAVIEEGRTDPSLKGMGTTLTGAFSAGSDLFVASVGDSRVYLFRRGRLLQLTRDQTYSQLLADTGQIPQHEVSTHHLRHILTDAIGVGAGKVNVNVRHLPLLDEDRLLLCTDGLTEMVDEEEIAGVLMRDQPAQDACQTLVDLALEHGGVDNVTVLLAKYEIPV